MGQAQPDSGKMNSAKIIEQFMKSEWGLSAQYENHRGCRNGHVYTFLWALSPQMLPALTKKIGKSPHKVFIGLQSRRGHLTEILHYGMKVLIFHYKEGQQILLYLRC